MYRINTNNGSSPRDRLDPRMLGETDTPNCSCGRCEDFTEEAEFAEANAEAACFDYSLAMVYAPHQKWQNLYETEDGFKCGTIFKELNKPFYGSKCMAGGCND